LANAVRRGGLITDLQVGVAISGIAMDNLRKIRTRLDDVTSLLLIQDIQRIESEREPFLDIATREHEWEMAVGCADAACDFKSLELSDPEECGLSEEEQKEIIDVLQQIADLPTSELRKLQLDQDNCSIASMRMLVVDLALRRYHSSSGTFPGDLSSLTPQPLSTLPLDPYTGKSFIYRRLDDASFHLYSTGPKMRDGGGQFGPWPSVAFGCSDLSLDTNDYPSHCGTVLQPQGFSRRIASAIRIWWCEWRK